MTDLDSAALQYSELVDAWHSQAQVKKPSSSSSHPSQPRVSKTRNNSTPAAENAERAPAPRVPGDSTSKPTQNDAREVNQSSKRRPTSASSSRASIESEKRQRRERLQREKRRLERRRTELENRAKKRAEHKTPPKGSGGGSVKRSASVPSGMHEPAAASKKKAKKKKAAGGGEVNVDEELKAFAAWKSVFREAERADTFTARRREERRRILESVRLEEERLKENGVRWRKVMGPVNARVAPQPPPVVPPLFQRRNSGRTSRPTKPQRTMSERTGLGSPPGKRKPRTPPQGLKRPSAHDLASGVYGPSRPNSSSTKRRSSKSRAAKPSRSRPSSKTNSKGSKAKKSKKSKTNTTKPKAKSKAKPKAKAKAKSKPKPEPKPAPAPAPKEPEPKSQADTSSKPMSNVERFFQEEQKRRAERLKQAKAQGRRSQHYYADVKDVFTPDDARSAWQRMRDQMDQKFAVWKQKTENAPPTPKRAGSPPPKEDQARAASPAPKPANPARSKPAAPQASPNPRKMSGPPTSPPVVAQPRARNTYQFEPEVPAEFINASVRELKRELTLHDVPCTHIVEKGELIAKVIELRQSLQARKQREREARRKARLKDKITREVEKWATGKGIKRMLNDINGWDRKHPKFLKRSSAFTPVSKAFKRSLLKIHPDKHMGDYEKHVRATEMFKEVNAKFAAFKAKHGRV